MKHYDAIIFDYGNTLVEFSKTQLLENDRAFHDALVARFGPLDFDRLHALRMRDRRACYEGDPPAYREADMAAITRNCIRELFQREVDNSTVDALCELRREAFLQSLQPPAYLPSFLGALRTHYRLGLLSNYVCGQSIRRSLSDLGLATYFDAVVVSAEVGYVKPHPAAFQAIVDVLGVPPGQTLFVGDNWLADVQGAKRAGMDVCLTRQFVHYEIFDAQPGDHMPDYEIDHLLDVQSLVQYDVST